MFHVSVASPRVGSGSAARRLRTEEVVREERADYTWHPVRPDDVLTESAAAGLHGERIDHDIVVLRAIVRAG